MKITLPKKKPAVYDIIPIAGAAVLCIILVISAVSRSGSVYAEVTMDSGVLALDLTDDGTYYFTSGGYQYTVEVSDGDACIVEADCPDKLCVASGKIGKSKSGSIVCVPGSFSITTDDGPETDNEADVIVP